MDRLLLIASTFCFLFGFAYTMHALGARAYRRSWLNFFAILGGFAFQTAFLYVRGKQLGRCPLTNLFEVLIFLSWAMVLFYLLIGPTYRLSLLGVFTSPAVFFFQLIALLAPSSEQSLPKITPNPYMELHAAVSIMAYGAFALAGVAGVMYLVQERHLKMHQLTSIFHALPPIRDLAVANRRLIVAGFMLLTLGIAAAFGIPGILETHLVKISWSVGVWLLYAIILSAEWRHRISARRGAWLSVAAFGVVLCTLWGITFLTVPAPR